MPILQMGKLRTLNLLPKEQSWGHNQFHQIRALRVLSMCLFYKQVLNRPCGVHPVNKGPQRLGHSLKATQ